MATDAKISPRCDGCGMSKLLWTGRRGRGIATPDGMFCCRGCAAGDECTCKARPVPSQEAEWQEARLAGKALIERQEMMEPVLTDNPRSEIDVPKEAHMQIKTLPRVKPRKAGPRRVPRRSSVRRRP